ncbi:MAG: hypothetical protein QG623_560 [Patescibacteria group bacterium]|nr:hypothetical protein [Patescibacteria group bacterium]
MSRSSISPTGAGCFFLFSDVDIVVSISLLIAYVNSLKGDVVDIIHMVAEDEFCTHPVDKFCTGGKATTVIDFLSQLFITRYKVTTCLWVAVGSIFILVGRCG